MAPATERTLTIRIERARNLPGMDFLGTVRTLLCPDRKYELQADVFLRRGVDPFCTVLVEGKCEVFETQVCTTAFLEYDAFR
jgi:hypothetical protein